MAAEPGEPITTGAQDAPSSSGRLSAPTWHPTAGHDTWTDAVHPDGDGD